MAFSKRVTDRTDVFSGRRTIGIRFNFVPETIEVSTCCSVKSKVIGGVCDPERSYGNICLHHVPGLKRSDSQVILNDIHCFNTVFNEEVVAFDSVAHVFRDCQEVDTVDGDNSGEGVMDGISFGV